MFQLIRRQRAPETEQGERIYAIGDVHGRLDLLTDLLNRIGAFDATLPKPRARHVVLLGDIVDRGPDSCEVIRLLRKMSARSDRLTILQGNHEQMMVMALSGQSQVMRHWIGMGGDAALRSFGVDPDAYDDDEDLLEAALAAVPDDCIAWLRALPPTARSGDYFFCHAGIRPGIALHKQRIDDILWIRNPFLDAQRPHGAMIVHGHSIETDVEMRSNRIGIDTGAYRTGILTALYLEGAARQLISTAPLIEAA